MQRSAAGSALWLLAVGVAIAISLALALTLFALLVLSLLLLLLLFPVFGTRLVLVRRPPLSTRRIGWKGEQMDASRGPSRTRRVSRLRFGLRADDAWPSTTRYTVLDEIVLDDVTEAFCIGNHAA